MVDNKKKVKKTKVPKKKNFTQSKSSINRNIITALQKSQLTTLRYKGGFSLSYGAFDKNYTTAFNMCSIWDPDYGNNTKNKAVQGHDLLKFLFERYKVYGFKAKVTAQNMSTVPQGFYVGAADSTAWVADYVTNEIYSDIISRKGVKGKLLAPLGSSKAKATLTYTCHPGNVIGMTKEAWKDDGTCGALMSANPAPTGGKSPYFIVGMANPMDTAAGTGDTVQFFIEIEFLTLVSDPRENNDTA